MSASPFETQPKVFVVVGPKGLYYTGLHADEQSTWTVAFGWPDEEDIKGYKNMGYYVAEATITWKEPT
jgi:hypothetical protein